MRMGAPQRGHGHERMRVGPTDGAVTGSVVTGLPPVTHATPSALRITRLPVGRRASGFVLVAQCLLICPSIQSPQLSHRARIASETENFTRECHSRSSEFTISECAQETPQGR